MLLLPETQLPSHPALDPAWCPTEPSTHSHGPASASGPAGGHKHHHVHVPDSPESHQCGQSTGAGPQGRMGTASAGVRAPGRTASHAHPCRPQCFCEATVRTAGCPCSPQVAAQGLTDMGHGLLSGREQRGQRGRKEPQILLHDRDHETETTATVFLRV